MPVHIVVVMVAIVVAMMVVVMIVVVVVVIVFRLFPQPAADIGIFAAGIVKTVIQQCGSTPVGPVTILDRRARV